MILDYFLYVFPARWGKAGKMSCKLFYMWKTLFRISCSAATYGLLFGKTGKDQHWYLERAALIFSTIVKVVMMAKNTTSCYSNWNLKAQIFLLLLLPFKKLSKQTFSCPYIKPLAVLLAGLHNAYFLPAQLCITLGEKKHTGIYFVNCNNT